MNHVIPGKGGAVPTPNKGHWKYRGFGRPFGGLN